MSNLKFRPSLDGSIGSKSSGNQDPADSQQPGPSPLPPPIPVEPLPIPSPIPIPTPSPLPSPVPGPVPAPFPSPAPEPLPPPSQEKYPPEIPTEPQDPDQETQKRTRYRILCGTEWIILANGLGALNPPSDVEKHGPATPVHPSRSWLFPTRGMPNGLYRDVVTERHKYFLYFHSIALLRWCGMIFQLFIGAALTGIGAMAFENGTPITIMAATNTIIAGILAMLHNSGLPDRYRSYQAEFEKVEDYLKALLNTGIVEEDRSVERIMVECFLLYREAKAAVLGNDPSIYMSGSVLQGGAVGRSHFPKGQGGVDGFVKSKPGAPPAALSTVPPPAPITPSVPVGK